MKSFNDFNCLMLQKNLSDDTSCDGAYFLRRGGALKTHCVRSMTSLQDLHKQTEHIKGLEYCFKKSTSFSFMLTIVKTVFCANSAAFSTDNEFTPYLNIK